MASSDLLGPRDVKKRLEPWETLKSQELFVASPWIKLSIQQVRLPDGRVVDDYYRINLPEYTIVFAQTTDGRVIVERQYKHGVGYCTLVLPSGLIEEGEDPLVGAQRELLEETGYTSDAWQPLGSFVAHGSYGCGKAHLFVARDARRVTEPDSGDLEDMEIILMKLEDIVDAIRTGDVVLLGTVTAIALATHRLVSQCGSTTLGILKIAGDMFVPDTQHVLGICDLIIEGSYDLNIWAYARVDMVKDGMVDKLKRAGFNWLAFGIEAASERVRDDVDKGFGQEEIFKTIEMVRAAGINVGANYIFGLPEDDYETMQVTLDMALELNTEWANFYCTMAYPGSPLYNVALREDWPLPESWSGYSQHSVDSLPLPTKYLPAKDVLRFRDRAFQVYFNSPRYLEMVQRKFGPDTVHHIREMSAHKIVRRF